MAGASPPSARFESILNFRDVGNTVNELGRNSLQRLRTNRLYRSARPDEASEADRRVLGSIVKTVIDLRSKTEHINAAKKHRQRVGFAQSAAVPTSNNDLAELLKVPGLRYEEINLNGKGFERALLWQLGYFSLARLLVNMALGYRTEGIAILGAEIMQPRGLIGLGKDTLDHCGPEVKQVFDVLSKEDAYPVLIHCTQGKDRTGITVLLALLLCEIDLRVITADYVKSEPELEAEKEERMQEIASIGLDESFAKCSPEFCPAINDYLHSKYGGIRQYLTCIGVTEGQQQTIRSALLA